MEEKRINIITNGKVTKVTADAVHLDDGRVIECNVSIWATGAEPQDMTGESSDIDVLQGYFRVNDYLQSTSHPNIFAGGDCVTMETYAG